MNRSLYGERDYAFGRRILTLRTQLGLTQTSLAKLLHISRRAVTEWEGGLSYPTAGHLQELIALGVRASAFPAGREAEEIHALWQAAHQKVLLDEPWLQEHLSQQASPRVDLVGEQPSSASHQERALWTVPYARNPHFTGRDDLLEHLMQQLAPPAPGHSTAIRRVALTQAQVIKGLGGIGKTQTAVEYAYRAREQGRYTHTLWIAAASEEAILTSFAALAELLPGVASAGETESRKLVAAVIRWLEQCSQPWLLIVDNADDLSLAQPYLPLQGNGSVLLTTRASASGWLAPSLEVDAMGVLEGVELLLRRAQRFAHASDDEINEATNLVVALAQFPLALDQAGAYIEETGCGVADYLHLYQVHRRTLLGRRGRQARGYPNSVATTWELSFQHVKATNPAAADLLRLCAFLAPDAIPEELLTGGAPQWPPALQQAVVDPFTFNQMLEALLAFSLIKRLAEHRLLSIHRLVQVVQQDSLSVEEQRQWVERLVRAVNAVFPREPQEVGSWPLCQRFLDQVQACDTLIQEQRLRLSEAADLFDRAGSYLYARGLYALAEPLYRRALSMREQLVGEAHPTSVQTLAHLASLYFRQGEFAAAEAHYQRALLIAEQLRESEQPLLVEVLRGLAGVYVDQGKYAQAEPLYQRALHLWEQLVESEQVRLFTVLTGLAFALAQQGKYAQAELLSQRALRFLERHLGPEHPLVATALLGLAQIRTLKEENAQVEPLNLRALRIREQYYGPEHQQVASALHALARLYTGQGKYAEAEPLYQRALRIREQQLGPENLDVSDSLRGLANLYFKEGRYAEAEPLYLRALHIREQQLGSENLVINDVLLGLANLYREQGKYMQAEPLYLQALHICEQQPERLETAAVLHDLARFQQAQGEPREAAALYQRALTIRENVLGADSPVTADTREQLQAALGALGRTEEATRGKG